MCIRDRDIRDPDFPRAQYRAEITYLDSELASLLNHPRVAAGHVAFTSDHGEILNDMGMYFNHSLSVPSTLHVPLILAGPGINKASTDAPVEHLGLGRTLLDLAGLGRIAFPGKNLLLSVESPLSSEKPRFSMGSNGDHAAITQGPWHLMLFLRKHRGFLREPRIRHQVELYNFESDPRLDRDLSQKHPELAFQLRESLVQWLGESQSLNLRSEGALNPKALAELASLGYAHVDAAPSSKPWIDPKCDCHPCSAWHSMR